MGSQDPKDVATDTARDLSELAALKADAHHCLTDPKYTALKHRLKDTHAAVEAAVVEAQGKGERGAVAVS
jgi:hypothetical protein